MCNQFYKLSGLIILTTILSACGGGSDSSNPPAIVGDGSTPTFTAGVFEDDALFKNRCQNPRNFNDINGNPYPDVQGSTLFENHWLRSWSNDTYLWYDEIIDQDPANFNDPLVYFETLKTDAITASGRAKDEFHFTQDTSERERIVQSGVSLRFGFRLTISSTDAPRTTRVRYIEPNSAADQTTAAISRGTEITHIDSVDIRQSSYDELLSLLSVPDDNSRTFTYINEVSLASETFTLTAFEFQAQPVAITDVISTSSGNVGYLLFNTFGTFIAEDQLYDAFSELRNSNVSDLVLDLRFNGGGFLYIASQLGYMIAGETATTGRTFETLRFNDKHPTINPVTGAVIEPTPFTSTISSNSERYSQGLALPELNLNRVFILTTSSTCSASEALINGLRGIDNEIEVILIGSTTCGKPYGFYATDNCGTTYFTVQLDTVNDKGEGGYADGFSPSNETGTFGIPLNGCFVADDLSFELGDTNEQLLSTALNYRTTGACSATTNRPQQQNIPASQWYHDGFDQKGMLLNEMKLLNAPTKP